MNKAIFFLMAFAAGGAAGFLASRQYHAQKYEAIAQEEIASVKATFRKKREAQTDDAPMRETANRAKEKPAIADYVQYASAQRYQSTEAAERVIPMRNDSARRNAKPVVIGPDELGENDEYEVLSLTYYADGILTDDNDTELLVDEIEEMVGRDALSSFGEYEEDSVFVRNDARRCYFEILLDQRRFEDVIGRFMATDDEDEED